MKFVNIASAKGLIPGKEVYTLNKDGHYGVGKLHSRTEDAKGLHMKFEVPQYTSTEKPPSITPFIVADITHVCIMKDRSEVVEVESTKELAEQLNGK